MSQICIAAYFHTEQSSASEKIELIARALQNIFKNSRHIAKAPRIIRAANILSCFTDSFSFRSDYIGDTSLFTTEKPSNHVLKHLFWSTYMHGFKLKGIAILSLIAHTCRIDFHGP